MEVVRRKDVYVAMILIAALLAALLSFNAFGLGGSSRYAADLVLLLTWVCTVILAVGVSCRQLPGEEDRRTIFTLLAKPITRAELIAGKWLGAWMVMTAALAAFYLTGLIALKAKGSAFDAAAMAQAWVLHAVFLGALMALGVAFSTRLTVGAASAMTYIIAAAALALNPRIPEFLASARSASGVVLLVLYYLIPHFELFDMRLRVVHEWGTLSTAVFLTVVAYGLTLATTFLGLAWLGYRRKRFERGALL